MRVFEAPPQTRDAILSKYGQSFVENGNDQQVWDRFTEAVRIEDLAERARNLKDVLEPMNWNADRDMNMLADIMRQLIGGDLPEGMTEWICYQSLPLETFANGSDNSEQAQMIFPEDLDRAMDTLTWYSTARKDSKVQNQMRAMFPGRSIKNPLEFSLYDLEDVRDALTPKKQMSARNDRWRPENKDIPESKARTVYDRDGYLIVQVDDGRVAASYGSGTRWCTSNVHTANSYLSRGPLYIVFKNGQKYAQIHGADNQVMDVRDRPLKTEPRIIEFLVDKESLNFQASMSMLREVDDLKADVIADRLGGIDEQIREYRKSISATESKLEGLRVEDNPMADDLIGMLFPSFNPTQIDSSIQQIKNLQDERARIETDGTFPGLKESMESKKDVIRARLSSQVKSVGNLLDRIDDKSNVRLPKQLNDSLMGVLRESGVSDGSRYGRAMDLTGVTAVLQDQALDQQYLVSLSEYVHTNDSYYANEAYVMALKVVLRDDIPWRSNEIIWLRGAAESGGWGMEGMMTCNAFDTHNFDVWQPWLVSNDLTEPFLRVNFGNWLINSGWHSLFAVRDDNSEVLEWADERVRELGFDWVLKQLMEEDMLSDSDRMMEIMPRLNEVFGTEVVTEGLDLDVDVDVENDELSTVLTNIRLPDGSSQLRQVLETGRNLLILDTPWTNATVTTEAPEGDSLVGRVGSSMGSKTGNWWNLDANYAQGLNPTDLAFVNPSDYPILSGRLFEFLSDPVAVDAAKDGDQGLLRRARLFSRLLVMPHDTDDLVFRQTSSNGTTARPPADFGWSCTCCAMPLKWDGEHWVTHPDLPEERRQQIVEGYGAGRNLNSWNRRKNYGISNLPLANAPDPPEGQCRATHQLNPDAEWSPHGLPAPASPNTLWCRRCWGVRAISKDMEGATIWRDLRADIPCSCGYSKRNLELYDAEEPTEAEITEELLGGLGTGGPTGLNQTAYEAEYVAIPESDMESFLTDLGFARTTVPRAKELVYDRTYGRGPDGGELRIRVYSSITGGRARKAGSDAIRVVPLYVHPTLGDFPMARMKRVHRVTGWRENLRRRIGTAESSAPGPVLDSNGKPMRLRRNGRTGEYFWGSVDYPANRETRPYRGG